MESMCGDGDGGGVKIPEHEENPVFQQIFNHGSQEGLCKQES